MVQYMTRCVELTWYMNILEPPMVLLYMAQRYSNFDTKYFMYYSREGHKFDYVVWPALLLHENGRLMIRGVAQPSLPYAGVETNKKTTVVESRKW
jgi:hypothetical protein